MNSRDMKKEIISKLKVFYNALGRLKSKKKMTKSDLFLICTLDRICDSIQSAILLREKNFMLDAMCICREIVEHLLLLGAIVSAKDKDKYIKKLSKSYMKDRLKLNRIQFLTGNYKQFETDTQFSDRIKTIIKKIRKNRTKEISGYDELAQIASLRNIYIMYYSYLSTTIHANSRSIQGKVTASSDGSVQWISPETKSVEIVDEMLHNFLHIANAMIKNSLDETVVAADYSELVRGFRKDSRRIRRNEKEWDKMYSKLYAKYGSKSRKKS